MSRRTTGIITAVVLILLSAAAGYGINNLVTTRAPNEGLSEAQVGNVVTRLIAARNEVLLTTQTTADDDSSEEADPEPGPADDLLDGQPSGGITMSQGAIVAERQTYRLIREHKRELRRSGTIYTEADLDIEVDSLTVNEGGTAVAFLQETTTFTGEYADGQEMETEQRVERIVSLSRVGGDWKLRSIRTISGKDAPENGL